MHTCLSKAITGAIVWSTIILTGPVAAQLTDEDITALRERGEREGWTFTVGKNPATEIPLEKLCGAREPEDWQKSALFDPCRPKAALPEIFDWRELDGCTPIRNQEQCGSCWAFSTVGTFECNIKITDAKEVDLSEQWLVSCNQDGHSCDGGWYCFDYFLWKTDPCGGTGAVMETDFIYSGWDKPCDCPYPHKYFIESWAFIGEPYEVPDIEAMKQAIMDHGPISVGVYAGSAMQAYSGGVFNVDEGDWTNHLVVLVGWDDTQGDDGVWIMRNSWGGGWGEHGYMLIEYGCSLIGHDACYITYRGVQRVGLGERIFSDALGDGDGILEGGETIELICAVANLGPDIVTDVSMILSIDDASLTVTDDSSYLGSIPSGDSLANTADPFLFEIPADYISRIDRFSLAVTWNCGPGCDTIGVDTMEFEMVVGPTTILIVDDDAGDDLEKYYEECFDARRIPSHRWIVSDAGEPSGSKLAEYDVVIWYTGDFRPGPLSGAGIAAMIDYLDSGGGLLLSGQAIAAQLGNPEPVPENLSPSGMQVVTTATPVVSHDNLLPPFLQDYLKTEFVSPTTIPILGADPAGTIFEPTDTVVIYGPGGAANQIYPDLINPIGDGCGELRYLTSDARGAVSYSGAYKTLFLSFGFEGIVTGNSRWEGRDTVLSRILNFFNYQMPDVGGQKAAAVGLPDADVIADMPATVYDAPSEITYAYQVYDDPGLTVPVTGAEDHPEGSGGKTYWQIPVPLVEDEDYYWRVRADNPEDTGIWSEAASFWVNAANQSPGEFDLVLPEDGSVIPDMWPTFLWNSAPEGDTYDSVSYRLYYSADPSFATADSICGLVDTSYMPPGPIDLGDHIVCYWKVRAIDTFDGETMCRQPYHFQSLFRGDANGDGVINIADAVFLINHVFRGGPAPDPLDAGDADCNGTLNIGDPVYLIDYIFRGGPPPGCW